MQYYVLCSFHPIVLIDFGCLSIVSFLLFQLPLMLLLQHRCAADTSNFGVLGAIFHNLKHEQCKLEVLHSLSGIFPLAKLPGLLIMSQVVTMSSSDRLARIHGDSITWSSTSFVATI